MKIKLGQTAVDLVTGYVGIVESRSSYLHGCDRYGLQAKMKDDGTIPVSLMVDEPQLKIFDDDQVIKISEPEQIIKLGLKVRDSVSGFKGISLGRVVYINGCARICISPKHDKDGKLIQSSWFDEEQIEIIEDKPAVKTGDNIKGGPAPSIPTRR